MNKLPDRLYTKFLWLNNSTKNYLSISTGTTSDIPYTVAVAISAPVAILSTIAFFVTLIILILIVIRKSAPRYKAQK